MAEILDIIDPNGELKDALQAARDNFLQVTKQNLRSGVYVMASAEVATAQSVTSTTFVDLTQFKGAFNSSGGTVLFRVDMVVSLSALNCSLELVLDGTTTLATAVVGCSPSALTTSVPLTKAIQVNAGNHTWKIQAKVDAGTATVGAVTGGKSSITILEFVKG